MARARAKAKAKRAAMGRAAAKNDKAAIVVGGSRVSEIRCFDARNIVILAGGKSAATKWRRRDEPGA